MIKPTGNRILIQPDKVEEKKTAGGIIVPQAAQKKAMTGTVVAMGPGLICPDSSLLTIPQQIGDLAVGDRVVYNKLRVAGNIQVDDEQLLLVDAEDIEAVIDADDKVAQLSEGLR